MIKNPSSGWANSINANEPIADRQTSERERLADDLERFGHSSTDCDAAVWQAAEKLRADEAEIAQLRAVIAQENKSRPDDWLIAENDRLRAENEALRTVTDRGVHDALNAYDAATGEGWQLPCAQGMRAALQSFIRSKESRRG